MSQSSYAKAFLDMGMFLYIFMNKQGADFTQKISDQYTAFAIHKPIDGKRLSTLKIHIHQRNFADTLGIDHHRKAKILSWHRQIVPCPAHT